MPIKEILEGSFVFAAAMEWRGPLSFAEVGHCDAEPV